MSDERNIQTPFDVGGFARAAADERLDEMARCFAEEFVRMGWSDEALAAIFRDPFYQGPHAVYQARGEEYVLRIIRAARVDLQNRLRQNKDSD